MTQRHQEWKECDAAVVSCEVQTGGWGLWPEPQGRAAARDHHTGPLSPGPALCQTPSSSLEMGAHFVKAHTPTHYGHVSPFQQASEVVGCEYPFAHFLAERTEAQRGRGTCPRTPSVPPVAEVEQTVASCPGPSAFCTTLSCPG